MSGWRRCADRVVVGDGLGRDAREPQQQSRNETRAVLAGVAVEHDRPRRGRHRRERLHEPRAAVLQETQIDDLGRRGVRWRGFRLGLDLKPALLVVVVEHGDVDDLDVEVARRVVVDLDLVSGDRRCGRTP